MANVLPFMRIGSNAFKMSEFATMMAEMKSLGFRPADVARKLNISAGAVSQYLSGYTVPSNTVLELMRRVVLEARKNQTTPLDETLTTKLSELQEGDSSKYDEVKALVEKLHAELPKAVPTEKPFFISGPGITRKNGRTTIRMTRVGPGNTIEKQLKKLKKFHNENDDVRPARSRASKPEKASQKKRDSLVTEI